MREECAHGQELLVCRRGVARKEEVLELGNCANDYEHCDCETVVRRTARIN